MEVLDDPQLAVNGIIEVHEDPLLGRVRQPRPAARFSATPVTVRRMAPYLGAGNHEIMTELGYSAADIEGFAAAGVLHARPPPAAPSSCTAPSGSSAGV